MGLQDPIFLLAFRGRVGASPMYKTHIPLTYVGKGGICADQMILWLPYLPVRAGEGSKAGSRGMGPNLRPI